MVRGQDVSPDANTLHWKISGRGVTSHGLERLNTLTPHNTGGGGLMPRGGAMAGQVNGFGLQIATKGSGVACLKVWRPRTDI